MLDNHTPLFIGYIDPGLGYTFQNLGPIIPTVLGFLGGLLAFFIKPFRKKQ